MIIKISKKADNDIDNILLYSIQNFGFERAEKYYDGLQNKLKDIANNSVLSRDCSFIEEGARRTNYESHAIYYKIKDEIVIIVRILHQRQDPSLHI